MKRSHESTHRFESQSRPTRLQKLMAAGLLIAASLTSAPATAAPPFSGTSFIVPNLITSADPSTFIGLVDRGIEERHVFDRRVGDYLVMDVYVYEAAYSDGHVIEIQVNPEFGDINESRVPAAYYAPVFGRIPNVLRRGVFNVWIHKGDDPFGGTPYDGIRPAVLIHTGALAQS